MYSDVDGKPVKTGLTPAYGGDLLAAVINGPTSRCHRCRWKEIDYSSHLPRAHPSCTYAYVEGNGGRDRLFYSSVARGVWKSREEKGAFKIPVAGGEPITVALKYGNRGAGSAYRRLDKRCDARSIGPPTDPCAPPHPLSLSLFVRPSRCCYSAPRPAIICYVRDSKLTAILAFCHSYVSPGRPSPDTWSRWTAISSSAIGRLLPMGLSMGRAFRLRLLSTKLETWLFVNVHFSSNGFCLSMTKACQEISKYLGKEKVFERKVELVSVLFRLPILSF